MKTGFRFGVCSYVNKKEYWRFSDYFSSLDDLFAHLRKREIMLQVINKKLIIIYEKDGVRQSFKHGA